jgi:hypothetical protein
MLLLRIAPTKIEFLFNKLRGLEVGSLFSSLANQKKCRFRSYHVSASLQFFSRILAHTLESGSFSHFNSRTFEEQMKFSHAALITLGFTTAVSGLRLSCNMICPRAQVSEIVCGHDNVTYNSECYATRCSGVQVMHAGACTAEDVPTFEKQAVDILAMSSGNSADGECFCAENWDPVCGYDGQVYANGCKARCAGTTVSRNLNSDATAADCVNLAACTCPALWTPVCGTDGVFYSNDCQARCAGVGVSKTLSSDATAADCINLAACTCPALWAPVCGTDGVFYSNDCEARCAGASVQTTLNSDATPNDCLN